MILQDQELSLRNAVSVSEAGLQAIHAGTNEFDMTPLQTVDSSAVAVMLSWQRQAQALNRSLQFIGVPASLLSLISLYGLTDFLICFPSIPLSDIDPQLLFSNLSIQAPQ